MSTTFRTLLNKHSISDTQRWRRTQPIGPYTIREYDFIDRKYFIGCDTTDMVDNSDSHYELAWTYVILPF